MLVPELPAEEQAVVDELMSLSGTVLVHLDVPITSATRELLREWTQQRMRRFADAGNTEVLSNSHAWGIFRGLAGEVAGASWLEVPFRHSANAPYDLRYNGLRIDVKATKRGMPLMVPHSQRYKLADGRSDALLLAWFDGAEVYVTLMGWVPVARFAAEAHMSSTRFPVPTLYMEAELLQPLGELKP